jgi:hypothetical protein
VRDIFLEARGWNPLGAHFEKRFFLFSHSNVVFCLKLFITCTYVNKSRTRAIKGTLGQYLGYFRYLFIFIYETPELFGAGDSHQARTIKILQPLRKSQDCGNIQKPACTSSSQKGKWNDAPMAALTSLISGCDTF